jgi:hypothetical protein
MVPEVRLDVGNASICKSIHIYWLIQRWIPHSGFMLSSNHSFEPPTGLRGETSRRRRTSGFAIENGAAHPARPRDKGFQTGIRFRHESRHGFKGLQNNPEKGGNHGHGPGDEPK